MGLGWICERELREGLGGRPLYLQDGVVLSTDSNGKTWRTALEAWRGTGRGTCAVLSASDPG